MPEEIQNENQAPFAPEPVDEVTDEPKGARDLLRAFEHEHLGPDIGRINGEIEKGSGSPYSLLTPEQRRQYVAIERLIEAEQKLNEAAAAHAQAQAAFDTALAVVRPEEV